jgi:hypothetical protein
MTIEDEDLTSDFLYRTDFLEKEHGTPGKKVTKKR